MAKQFLGSGGGDKSVTTTNLNKNVNKLGNQVAKGTLNLLDKGKGFNAFPGQPYSDLSSQTVGALGQMEALAGQGNPFYQPSADFTGGLIGGDYAHDTSGFSALYGQNPNALAMYGTGIASGAQSQTAVDQYGRRIAAGNQGIDTEAAYRDLLGRVDPEFENVVQNTANDVGDQIQRQFGGASFGSGSNADYLTKGIGDVVSQMRSANFYNNLGAQQGILGDITGVQNQNINNILGASGLLSGEQGQNLARQLSAASALSGEQQQGFNNNRGILGDVANLNQQSLQNQMQGVSMAPSVYGQQYLPSQILAGVGSVYDTQSDKELNALKEQFFMKDNKGWNQLMAATGMLGGAAGGTNSSQTQQTQQASNPAGTIAGGAMLASQVLPTLFGWG